MIPPEIKWDPDAVPPQYTNYSDQIIEKGTNLRIKLIGLRNDVRNMFAIGSIKEDYLGYGVFKSYLVYFICLLLDVPEPFELDSTDI